MYSTLIRNVDRQPEDSGQWPRAPRPFRQLPRTERHDAPRAPVVMAWLLVIAACGIPFAMLDDAALALAVLLNSLFAPALGNLWVLQFRPVSAKEAAIRTVLWSVAAIAAFMLLTGHVIPAVAMAPYYTGFAILAVLFTNWLLQLGKR